MTGSVQQALISTLPQEPIQFPIVLNRTQSLELSSFAQDLQTWTQAGTTLVVTDAIPGQIGLAFYGPSMASSQCTAIAIFTRMATRPIWLW